MSSLCWAAIALDDQRRKSLPIRFSAERFSTAVDGPSFLQEDSDLTGTVFLTNNAIGPDLTADFVEEEIIRKVMQAMHDADIFPTDDLIADGDLHRVHCEDDSAGSLDGWYVIHADAPVPYAIFGNWRLGEDQHIWTAKGIKELSPQERDALEKHRAEAIKLQQEAKADASAKCKAAARRIWTYSVAAEAHPYLTKKGIEAHGARQYKGALVIPLSTCSGELVGMQFINGDGEKRFLPGTAKSGAFYKIEGNPTKLAICEGFATGASIREAVGYSVAVAFDAGNLLKVGQALRAALPSTVEIVVCADNDASKENNTGIFKGRAAAVAIGAKWAYPVFQGEHQGSDFNDLYHLAGAEAVKNTIEAATLVAEAIEKPDHNFKEKNSDEKILDACTDVTNSLHLSHAVQDKAVFVPEDKEWAYCMDDGYWKFGCSHRVTETAKGIGQVWLQLSEDVQDPKLRGNLKGFAKYSASSSGISAMIKLAATQEHMRRGKAEFDNNPAVIGVKNGVLNLENLCFRQAQPTDYVTRRLGAEYVHNAQCPKWTAFLMESVEGDTPEEKALMVQFLQLMVAAALLGVKGLRKIFHIYGPPGSGKSLFVNTLHSFLGDYGKSMSASAISNPRFKDNDVKMPEIAELVGMRFAAVYENGEGFCFNDELLKALTGGDYIKARMLHKNPFSFRFGGVLLSVGNGLPNSSTGASKAFMERLQLISFPNAVPMDRRNENLENELKEELSGILNWAIEGVQIYREQGIAPPPRVARAGLVYRESVDAIQCFIDECCERGPDFYEPKTEFLPSYRRWASDNGFPIYGPKTFWGKMEEKGFKCDRRLGRHSVIGIRTRRCEPAYAPPQVDLTYKT